VSPRSSRRQSKAARFFQEKRTWSEIKDSVLGTYERPHFEKVKLRREPVRRPSILTPTGLSKPSGSTYPTPQRQPTTSQLGHAAANLRLPDLTGRTRDLREFRGHSTVLLFWNPECGFCQRMIGNLKSWERNPPTDAPTLLVVSTGTVEANWSLGLQGPIVLDEDFRTGWAFGATGTPSAVLLDANGKIASDVVAGAPMVLALLGAEQPAGEKPISLTH
jgi:thiol-disulfide isomerase/thioredoxin